MDAATGPPLGVPAYVVLGMVRLGARSGYEIKRTVEQSIRYFWTISQVQIYPSLEQLERAGLIAGRADPRGRRRRRVYEITAAGEAALRTWLAAAEPLPFELRDAGLVKLFFADALEPGGALALLGAITRRSEERIAALRAIEPAARRAGDEGNVYPLLTLRMGIGFHQAIIDVCEDFERRHADEGRRPLTGSSDVTDPAVRALIAAINAGDRAAFFAALAPGATMSDDGKDRDLAEWADREIFSSAGHIEVLSARDGGRSLVAAYRNDTWGEMRTRWAFTVTGGKVSRFETGQA